MFMLLVFLTLFIEKKKKCHSKTERNVTELVVFQV